jgi:hypothetical protein
MVRPFVACHTFVYRAEKPFAPVTPPGLVLEGHAFFPLFWNGQDGILRPLDFMGCLDGLGLANRFTLQFAL